MTNFDLDKSKPSFLLQNIPALLFHQNAFSAYVQQRRSIDKNTSNMS